MAQRFFLLHQGGKYSMDAVQVSDHLLWWPGFLLECHLFRMFHEEVSNHWGQRLTHNHAISLSIQLASRAEERSQNVVEGLRKYKSMVVFPSWVLIFTANMVALYVYCKLAHTSLYPNRLLHSSLGFHVMGFSNQAFRPPASHVISFILPSPHVICLPTTS